MKNCQVRGGYVLHIGNLEGAIKVGDSLKLFPDWVRNGFIQITHFGILNITTCALKNFQ